MTFCFYANIKMEFVWCEHLHNQCIINHTPKLNIIIFRATIESSTIRIRNWVFFAAGTHGRYNKFIAEYNVNPDSFDANVVFNSLSASCETESQYQSWVFKIRINLRTFLLLSISCSDHQISCVRSWKSFRLGIKITDTLLENTTLLTAWSKDGFPCLKMPATFVE